MRIRGSHLTAMVFALILSGISASALRPGRADDAKADEPWKLTVLAFGDDEFAIVKLGQKDGKPTATVIDAQKQILGENAQIKNVDVKGADLTFTLTGQAGDNAFQGKLAKAGPNEGKYLGQFQFRGSVYPASLETTTSEKVGPLKESPLALKLQGVAEEKDVKSKIKKLEEIIRDNHGHPNNHILYNELLGAAAEAKLESKKVAEVIKQWTEEAKPYGDAWLNEVRFKALKAVGTSKSFAKVGVELAQELDKAVKEEAVEQKAMIVGLLAGAARHVGMEELAKEADARHAKLEARLDEEYHKKVPPFKPAPYAGRKNPKANQAVLMELFTGAQCPPCVAADVAFDALFMTYKPTEFIGLQYHLHIPGPDPLTNNDSEERQKYYGSAIRGTPSTFFNGKDEAGGGGGMAASENKYEEFRPIIDKILETTKEAEITLSATRAGDQIKIVASAQVNDGAGSVAKGAAGEKSKEKKEKSKQALRLALTEESIRYVGGNKLRYHHHVVRAFPGGTEGKDLTDGKGKVDVTLGLGALKSKIETYLSDFTKKIPFPHPLPEIKLENLAVVAFVQDDNDKSIIGAVSVPVNQVNP